MKSRVKVQPMRLVMIIFITKLIYIYIYKLYKSEILGKKHNADECFKSLISDIKNIK